MTIPANLATQLEPVRVGERAVDDDDVGLRSRARAIALAAVYARSTA